MRAAMLGLLFALAGCSFGDEKASRACKTTIDDCFEAQGEVCNQVTKQCEVPPDAGALEVDDEPTAPVEAPEVTR